jgi:serine/threonine protein kinase
MSEGPTTPDWPAPAAVSPDWPAVPGYEILAELGRGGMGVVYRARQLSSQRTVALKLLRDGALAGPQERARFRIEAEAAARVRHPNVVEIYEVREDHGRPCFAMELVEGGTLEEHLAGKPQPAAWAAGLVRTLALAVQHAHAQHVVHRDLKPANILLALLPEPQASDADRLPSEAQRHAFTPKIADFGLAKRLDSHSTAWTQEGAVLGTAGYLAPEQASGRVQEIGPAVDVWAMGAILYELLTGRPPFQAESWTAMLEAVLHEEPAPPSRWRPDVPPDLETVCLKCLEKQPGRRYASAEALAEDLGRFLEGASVAAVPLGATERLARLAARDGFRLVDEIGHGPRSTVYRALQGPLGQPVALKVFRAGICSQAEWEARLRRDTELRAGLAHPHIVPVQGGGWWDGSPYLAVEYAPHGSLAARLARGPYPVREALGLVERLAETVSYLHRQGVVHGNLKPSNVLLAADGIPRLTDLHPTGGLFQAPLGMDDGESASLGYLAPEVIRDPGGELRLYTDIYGLGIILYELLTGRPPFAGAGARETVEQVRSQDPVPPSQLNSRVTPPVEAICRHCLQKNPWRRYVRAYDLSTHLRHLRNNPEEGGMPGEPWSRRRTADQGQRPQGAV